MCWHRNTSITAVDEDGKREVVKCSSPNAADELRPTITVESTTRKSAKARNTDMTGARKKELTHQAGRAEPVAPSDRAPLRSPRMGRSRKHRRTPVQPRGTLDPAKAWARV
eukprot:5006115-Pyramimonas_sp.AAC.1